MKLANLGAVALAVASSAMPTQAIVLGQIDTFSDGTTQGWGAGGGPVGSFPPVPPAVVDGGPGGAGDKFLQITANGSAGPGGRLVAMNTLGQWSGDYTGPGISGIAMHLKNLGSTDLTVRLYFEDPIPGPPLNEAVTGGAFLQAGSNWTHVVFQVSPASLTVLQGSAATLLGNTRVLRIYSGGADFPPDPVVAVLGVDNIQAVPEPASVALMLGGLVAVAGVAARRRR